jgi:branched-subunit amino acid aminotransferase/4-amino-4-deoxychorismate lyase
LKSLSYLSYVLASSEARRQGADEALLVRGPTVLETTSANVFAVVDGKLWTPPAAAGILLGVTRDVVVTLARERAIAVHEERVDVKDLGRADEIFLTGSVRGLRAVSTVDHTVITDPIPGPVTHTLRAAYAERLETVSSEPETT